MARKILLADDSVTAQNMGRKILADAGYEVLTVNNGSAALKKIAEIKPDMVVLDVYMPGYSGLEVCQRMKEAQDTARIPVLLSVGKLEPFKPEEAQRVRAEGYIVKPFEASELLAALSKLEDKIIPRPEPTKPGRFARAIAAVGESGRSVQGAGAVAGDSTGEQNGWKERLSFPHDKAKSEDKSEDKEADDPSLYNAMNRDLRTVVETPEEMAAGMAEPEPSLDVAAFVPPGLPKDVTPEEVAAIAAASAQIQMASEALREDSGGTSSHFERETQTTAVESAAAAQDRSLELPDGRAAGEVKASEKLVVSEGGSAGQTAAPSVEVGMVGSDVDSVGQALSEPVTMATASGAPEAMPTEIATQWRAVAVALESGEAGSALETEMQESHAAFIRETNSGANEDSLKIEAAQETCVAEESKSAEQIKLTEHAKEEPVAEVGSAEPEVPKESIQPVAITDSLEPLATISPGPELDPNSGEAPPVIESAAGEARLEEVDALPQGMVGAAEREEMIAEATPSSQAFASVVHEPEVVGESDAVKSTAAAWASWRQIRDSKEGDAIPQTAREEFAMASPKVMEEVAMAVAAGAEQSLPENMPASPQSPADIASIVESVLADLRPKLMAEISRKMAEK